MLGAVRVERPDRHRVGVQPEGAGPRRQGALPRESRLRRMSRGGLTALVTVLTVTLAIVREMSAGDDA